MDIGYKGFGSVHVGLGRCSHSFGFVQLDILINEPGYEGDWYREYLLGIRSEEFEVWLWALRLIQVLLYGKPP